MATADSAALDDFLNRFRTQVDGGFGLIAGDVGHVFATLVIISVALTALLWALDENQNVTAAFIRKVLLVGFFAWLITNWHSLSTTVVEGFTALGLKAGAGGLSLDDFVSTPSNVVNDGFTVAFQLIKYIGELAQQGAGFGFFTHFDVILVAAVAAIGIILAFIVLGVEVAVTIIEFHVVTLVAFVTVPFGVLAQTSFLSERAIGYVVSVGVKLMALALVVSIGEGVFKTYVVSPQPTIPEECGLLLAAIVMLMLALKIPGIAGALITGGPQLSAGSAVAGTAALAAGVGGAALAGRFAAGSIGSALGGAAGAGKVGAANAAAGALPGRDAGSSQGAGAASGSLRPSTSPRAAANDAGAAPASTAEASASAAPAEGSSPSFAETLAQPAVNKAMKAALAGGAAEDTAFQRALQQPAVNAAMQSALRGGGGGGAEGPSAPRGRPDASSPSPSDTVAGARARFGAGVVASEGLRAAAGAHVEGGGVGMTPTLHAPDPES